MCLTVPFFRPGAKLFLSRERNNKMQRLRSGALPCSFTLCGAAHGSHYPQIFLFYIYSFCL